MPNSVSICSLMGSTNVPYTSSQKRARTGLPDAEMVPVGVVSHAAIICLVTQRSSPQTAAETWTTFLAHCVCDKFSEPIMHQQNEGRWFPVYMCQIS